MAAHNGDKHSACDGDGQTGCDEKNEHLLGSLMHGM